MKKRIISYLILLGMLLSILPLGLMPVAAATTGGTAGTPAGTSGTSGTPTPAPGSMAVTDGFTVTGDEAGYTYDWAGGLLTIKDGAVLEIKNTGTTATTHKIVVEKDASVYLILAGVNIDVSSGDGNCAFEIAEDSAGSVTVTLADGTTNILKSGSDRAGLEKEGTNGSLTIRCAHSGETGHVCDTTTCGALEASSANCAGAGIGSGSDAPSGDVSNIVISGGNVTAIGGTGAGIGSGSGFESGAVSNITICGGNVRSRVLSGAGIGSGMGEYSSGDVSNIVVFGGNVTVDGSSGAGIGSGFAAYSAVSSNSGDVSNITISGGSVSINISDSSPAIGSGYADDSAGDVTNIIISGGSVKASGGVTDIGKGGTVGTPETPVTPTDAKGNNVYLCKMAIIDPATSVTVNGISYGKHTYYHPSGWTTENYAYIYLPNGFYPYGESGLLMAKNGTVTLDLTPTATVTDGFTVTGDAAGYTYDQTNGVLTVKNGAVLMIKNTGTAATTHKIVVEKDTSVDLTLAGVNIDVSSGNENCAFEIAEDSAGSVTVTLADGTTNILKSGSDRAGLEKEGTNGSLTIRCAHSGESGHVCDTTSCGALEASSYDPYNSKYGVGAGIGSGRLSDANADVSNITICGGNVTASSSNGAGIGSGSSSSRSSGAVSNITISGGNVRSSFTAGTGIGSGMGNNSGDVSNITISGGSFSASGNGGAGIGSGYATSSGAVSNITISGGSVTINISTNSPAIGSGRANHNAGNVSNIIISGGSVKASGGVTDIGKGDFAGTPVTPTDGKGNNVYLCEIENAEGKPVTVNGKSYPAKHRYHDGSAWTTEGKLYPYLPGDGSVQLIRVGDTTSAKLYSGTGFVDVPVVLLDSTGTAKGYYTNLADAVTAAAAGDTIQLVGDVTITGSTVDIDKQLTLDLNGKTVSCDGVSQLFAVKTSGDLTIRDGVGGGKIAARYFTAVSVAGSFTLEGGTVETSGAALNIIENATVTLKGGTVKGQLQNRSGTLYADGGEMILGASSTNGGIITRHADAATTTKFRGNIGNGVLATADSGTIEAGEFYGDVMNVWGSTICGGTFHGTVTNKYNEASSKAGIIKAGGHGGNYYNVTINGSLVFEGGKNGTGYNDATNAWTFADVTKEYLENTLKLGGTGYVQSGDTYYILGASGLHSAATAAAASGGTLVLIKDVTIDKTLNITGTVTLDLNGCLLKYESENEGSVIKVNSGADFTLKDSSAEQTGKITGGHAQFGGGVFNEGTFTMEGGIISGCTATLYGGGVCTVNGSPFTMQGGEIIQCTAQFGGGVYAGTTILSGYIGEKTRFIMNGGKIIDCTATQNGGGVYISADGDFIMTSGKISGCTAAYGAVAIDSASFIMQGGEISGSTAGNAGALCNGGAAAFYLHGGTIFGCDVIGGAYYYNYSSSDATICYGNLKFNKTPGSKCIVKFMDGESLYAWHVATASGKAVRPIDPQKAGYKFVGWYNGDTEFDFDKDVITGDGTHEFFLTAKWEEPAYLPGLNDAIKALDDAREELNAALGTKADASELQQKVNELNQAISDLNAQVAALTAGKADVTALNDAIASLKNTEIKALQQALDALEAAVGTVDPAGDDLQTQITKLNTALNDLNTALTSAINTAKNEAIEKAKELVNAAKSELEEALNNKAGATELADAITKLNKAIDDIKNLDTKDTALQNQLTALIGGAEGTLKAAEDRLKTLESDMDQAKDDIDAAKTDINKLISDLEQAKNDINNSVSLNVGSLRADISALTKKLNDAKTALETADAETKTALETAISGAQLALNTAVGQLQANLDKAKSELEKSIADGSTELGSKITALNTALEAAQAALEAADAENKSELSRAISDAQTALQAAIDKLSSELAGTKSELEAKDAQQQTLITIVCVIACIALAGDIAIAVVIIISKRKRV